MIRVASVVIILLMVGTAVGLYRFKEHSADQAERIQSLRAQIASERERISLLQAEWTYLNQPDRIQDLSTRHLELERIKAAQIGTIESLPMRPIDIDPLEGDRLGALAGDTAGGR